ncbi:MAG: hypothetical protein GX451_06835 [Acholeplasmataceae bacterium]|nr:hypothetical protein [Acholeplasmataceae bacterium]
MNNKVYIGIDNGATGTIGFIYPDGTVQIMATPIKVQQDYTKKKHNISRLNHELFKVMLDAHPFAFVGLERPMVNATRFKASASGLRVFEAQLVIIEQLKTPYVVFDSKTWQKEFFPQGHASGETKELSNQVGRRLFPSLVNPFKDYDGILIAKYLQLKGY